MCNLQHENEHDQLIDAPIFHYSEEYYNFLLRLLSLFVLLLAVAVR